MIDSKTFSSNSKFNALDDDDDSNDDGSGDDDGGGDHDHDHDETVFKQGGPFSVKTDIPKYPVSIIKYLHEYKYTFNPILHGLFWAGWSRGEGGMESTTHL